MQVSAPVAGIAAGEETRRQRSPPLRHLRFRAGALRFSPQVVPVVHIWCTSHTEPFVDRGRARSSSAKRWRSARAPSPEMVMSSVTDKAH